MTSSTAELQTASRQAVVNLTMSPQCRLVLDFLRSGRTLTNLIALTTLGIGSVTKRIADLRAMRFDIKSEPRTGFGGKSYHAYWLED